MTRNWLKWNGLCYTSPKQPYRLHDCHINRMEIADGNLKLFFKEEITRINRPGVPGLDVYGHIVVEGIDPDFCTALIAGKGGSMGGFRGERLTISEFTEKYKGYEYDFKGFSRFGVSPSHF